MSRNEPPVETNMNYFAEYNLSWGFSSLSFIIPSVGIRLLGVLLHYFGFHTPMIMTYVHMAPDTLLFVTQPVCLTMIRWKAFNKESLPLIENNNVCETRFQTGSDARNKFDPRVLQVGHQFHPMPSVSPISSVETNFYSVNSHQLLITPRVTPSSSMNSVFDPGSQTGQLMDQTKPNWPPIKCSPQIGQQGQYLNPKFGLFATSSLRHIPQPAFQANQQFSSPENMTVLTFVSQ